MTETSVEGLYADSLKNSKLSHYDFYFLFCDKVFFVSASEAEV